MSEMIDQEIAAQCSELQEDEISVLESIYPSLMTVHPNPDNKPGRLLTLNLPIALPAPIGTKLDSFAGPSATLELSHLPPLSLRLVLPAAYPSQEAAKPVFLRASLPNGSASGEKNNGAGNWLPRNVLRAITDKLGQYWAEEKEACGEGVGVIWKWWEWVGTGEFLSELVMIKDNTLELTVPPMITPSTFYTMLKTYNAGQIHSDFERTAFSCSICLENRKGKSCIQMPSCGCVFCTPCLSSCWSLAITEGSLESVSCPSVSCTKTRALRDRAEVVGGVDADLVESVVGKDLRERWEDIKERRKAEIDPSYTICPRPTCQAAVPPPAQPDLTSSISTSSSSRVIRLSDITSSSPTSTTTSSNNPVPRMPAAPASPVPTGAMAEDRWERYRVCPKCSFSFCLYCNATWHGPHTPCAFPQTSLIVTEYLSYPEDSEGRKKMELRRGKANIERMVAKHLEDEANKQWLEGKTRACAGCGVRVEKRCGEPIKPTDPYKHFNTPGRACYMKLFDAEELARHERETLNGGEGGGFDDEWREVRGIWEW
ncbi:hypothetical protein I317_04394 [Kwoniella heveanensis CBS 569]|nr:hypothetical protein I317_04394 [Kwoniella heveanensis CBS 569]